MAEVNWDEIKAKLPYERTPEQKEKREEIFRGMDVNGNGIMSLAEIDKALRDYLAIDEIFDAKPAIMRAFQAAKDKVPNSRPDCDTDDYVTLKELRFFFKSLRMYFEYWLAFKRIDADSDRRLSFEEFNDALPTMELWQITVEDPQAEFDKIDGNDGGLILFDEFCKWAIKKNLDLEDDDE